MEIKPVDESKKPKHGVTLQRGIREHVDDSTETLYFGGEGCLGLTPKYKPDLNEDENDDDFQK